MAKQKLPWYVRKLSMNELIKEFNDLLTPEERERLKNFAKKKKK